MLIKVKDKFVPFEGFSKKVAETIRVVFDNCTADCSADHRFVLENGREIYASELKPGMRLVNTEKGGSTVVSTLDTGKKTVYTPVNVDGGLYSGPSGLVSHNCSFIGSSPTLVSSTCIEGLMETEPVETLYEDLSLNIYLKPRPDRLYVMGVDCASGVGNDYACVQVIEVRGRNEMEQAAVYRSNTVGIGEFSRIVDDICKRYNNAYYILENNDVGKQVAEELWYTLENMYLINTEKAGHGLGTKADKRSKLDACMELKRVMDAGILKIHDAVTIKEISTFEEQTTANVFKASKGNHDDTVSALYWAVYATMQPEIDLDHIRRVDIKKEQDDMTVDMMADAAEYTSDDFWADFK